jgi:Flp pilus assembly protein protease CpaA
MLRFLLRVLILIAGAVIGLALFLFAVVVFLVIVAGSLLTGRKPDVKFAVNRNPWSRRRAPTGDVVDIEAREVKDESPLPLQRPEQR